MTHSPLIAALDYPSLDAAREGAARIAPYVGMVKVGLELFVEAGPEAARLGEAVGLPVFLDLKLHDIPATVERAVARAAGLGVRLLTVHAGGGPAMLDAAVKRAAKENTGLSLLAVTVLTSLEEQDLREVGVESSVEAHVLRLARVAAGVGVEGFVCSPQEASLLRRELGAVTLVTPGVRGQGDAAGDQKRVATVAEAIAAGADWLVVGRPLRDAPDPAAAARRLAEEARAALATRSASSRAEAP